MRVSPRSEAESGFTLIELLVAMVLTMIVLAMIVGVLIDLFGSSERSAARSKAQRSSVAAGELLLADLRAMRAPNREPRWTGSADNLRNLLLRGVPTDPPGLRIHDLVVADPSRIRFYAELFQSAGNTTPECVTWQVTPTGALHRTVQRTTCTGSAIQQTEVMPAPPTGLTAAGAIPTPFRYRLLVQPDPQGANIDPDACTTQVLGSASTAALPGAGATDVLRRDQVMGIDMDLRSFVSTKVGRGDQELVTAASIVSRQSQEYRFAIGCVA